MKRIYLSPPCLFGAEREWLEASLQSGYVAPCGPMCDRFELDFARVVGRKHAVSLSSCTAAIDLICEDLGIGPGDKVACQSLTFIASIAPAVRRGAVPRFIDVSPKTWLADLDLVERLLSRERVRLLVAVDLYGQCNEYAVLADLCARHGVALLIDSAEALGSFLRGAPAGMCPGVSAVYSFNGNKIITTSGGGMVVTDDAELAARLRSQATQAREPVAWYEHKRLGHNYRMGSLAAALGVAQLQALPDAVRCKRRVFERYREALPELSWMPEAPGVQGNRWLSVALFEDASRAERVRLALAAADIESRPVWKPLHLQPVFAGVEADCPVSEDLFRRGLCLPSGCGLTLEEQQRVIAVVRDNLR